MFVTKITVMGDSGNEYEITPIPDGGVHCTCPAWKYAKLSVEQRICKHVAFAHGLTQNAK